MTITYERAGTAATGGPAVNPLNVVHNAVVNANDLAILIKNTRNDNDAADTTPSGWTLIGTVFGGVGAFGTGTGNARATAWYRICDGTEDGATIAITWNVGTANACTGGQVLYFSKTLANWEVPVEVNGTDAASDTSWSVLHGSLAHAAGDVVIAVSAENNSGGAQTAQALSATGVTYGAITQRANVELTNASQGHLRANTSTVSVGATAAPTFTATIGVATAGAGLLIRLRESAASSQGKAARMLL